ncbi:hypothetical protein NPIL_106331 [Nephila pilipes]|uniref:Uncharacterized protein n=1 Tax=Nephila pilipes TaxID=299642 RepID=A0A8X6T5N7_NEPPI|nr:hypothetical protein NPIL_106331 [Nephila pilipes]
MDFSCTRSEISPGSSRSKFAILSSGVGKFWSLYSWLVVFIPKVPSNIDHGQLRYISTESALEYIGLAIGDKLLIAETLDDLYLLPQYQPTVVLVQLAAVSRCEAPRSYSKAPLANTPAALGSSLMCLADHISYIKTGNNVLSTRTRTSTYHSGKKRKYRA